MDGESPPSCARWPIARIAKHRRDMSKAVEIFHALRSRNKLRKAKERRSTDR
jgi:hypothetical protein